MDVDTLQNAGMKSHGAIHATLFARDILIGAEALLNDVHKLDVLVDSPDALLTVAQLIATCQVARSAAASK